MQITRRSFFLATTALSINVLLPPAASAQSSGCAAALRQVENPTTIIMAGAVVAAIGLIASAPVLIVAGVVVGGIGAISAYLQQHPPSSDSFLEDINDFR